MNLRPAIAFCVFAVWVAPLAGAAPDLGQAFDRMYAFDFPAAHHVLDEYTRAQPQDPLGPAVRSAAYLFSELDRLSILEAQFLVDDKQIADKRKKLTPDPAIRRSLDDAIARTRKMAEGALASNPNDANALFAMCVATGVQTDYSALVEKKQLGSLSYAKESQNFAVRLLKVDPDFSDAYLSTGVSEYLIGSLPFFVRWFVRFDQVNGSKQVALRNLEKVASSGRYLGPFARILLSVIHLREKRPQESQKLLTGLARDYPSNPLIRKELARVTEKLASAARPGASDQ